MKDPVLPTLRKLRAGPGTGPFQHVTQLRAGPGTGPFQHVTAG
jgi:hypothetical protein